MVEEAGVPGENHRPWASNFLVVEEAGVPGENHRRRPVLVVEEARVPGENHRPGQATGQLRDHLQLRVACTFFVTYTAGANPRRIVDRLV